jgi:hypothetical protein
MSQPVGSGEYSGDKLMRTATSQVRLAIAAAAMVLFGVPSWGAESAVWTPRELSFVYLGITTLYSCEGLRDRVREVLLQLGARRDLELQESPCMSLNGPDAFPGVRIKVNILQRAAGQGSASGPGAVSVHWKSVELTSTRNPVTAAGECELLEQIRHEIIPLFATRNVAFGSNCLPHQLQLGAAWLRAEVLVPDENPAAPLSTGRPGPAPDR